MNDSMIVHPARRTFLPWLALLLLLTLPGCGQRSQEAVESMDAGAPPIDRHATNETWALLQNLHRVGEESVLFGHQDSLAYGVEWLDEPGQSDVKEVTGDYPALYGWDIGNIELGDAANLDGVSFSKMQGWIKEVYGRGGVVTISWHMNHPITQKPSWETAPGAADILPGGDNHQALKIYLDRFADFVAGLQVQDNDGNPVTVPVIFRPWHEHNGDWFWWGKRHTTEEEFVELWRFTVEYLRDEKQLHNLLYAFSPDRSRTDINNFREDYLYAYPGDGYVDILGLDNYWDLGHPANDTPREQNLVNFATSLENLVAIAQEKNKLPAMTEGGQDTLPDSKFWTGHLLAGILANEHTRKIAYVQVWRNANREKEGRDHFYVPYQTHPAAADFVEFYRHPAILFESDLPDMYSLTVSESPID